MHALLVSYVFPPSGGGGVGRVLKLQKWLPTHGVRVSVLTVANPSVPVTDSTLAGDVRHDTTVHRARTFEPGYAVKRAAWRQTAERRPGRTRRFGQAVASLARQALVPDPQVLWQPAAHLALARILASADRPDVVFISAPPFSQFLLAPLARLAPGTAVVLDYRDEWITYRNEYEMMGRLAARLGDPLERALLRRAHAVTAATSAFRDNLCASFPFLDPGHVHTLPNGYDPDDFPAARPEPSGERLCITYAGTIFKLTSPRGLIGAVRLLHAREPELARLLEVQFIGRIVDTEEEVFAGTEALGVRRLGYRSKGAVVDALSRSHVTLCLLDDVPGNERIFPAKVFELMYLDRPCLTLSPPGALADLAARHRLGPVLSPRDEAAICAYLADTLRAFRDGRLAVGSPAIDTERFHRGALAGELAGIFEDAVARARRA